MIKKQFISLILVMALMVGFVLPMQTALAADYSYIKVRLASMGSVSSVTFTLNGSYYIVENPYYPLTRGKTYTVKASGSGVALVDGSKTTYIGANATFIRSADTSSTNWLTINNTKTGWTNYPGDVTFSRNGSYVDTVCKLFMETYLVGVVAHEMSPSWPAEALKTQAVAARTYAMRYINSSNRYDVVDTTSNQVYKGYNPSKDGPVIEAINATAGQVILWNNSFADGVYSASNGGQTMTRVPKWGSVNYYHQLKDDPYDKKNPASPQFIFVFPKQITSTHKLDSRLDQMIRDKAVGALANEGISTSASKITIMGIESLNPHTLPPDNSYGSYPAGSYQFTKVDVNAIVDYSGNAELPDGQTSTGEILTTGTVRLQSSTRMRVRSGPSTAYEIAGYVDNGSQLDIYEIRSDGWLQIKQGDLSGYVMASYVDMVPYVDDQTDSYTDLDIPGTVKGDSSSSITLYEKPSTDSSVNAALFGGVSVTITQVLKNGWVKVKFDILEGYTQRENIEFDESLIPEDATTIEDPVQGKKVKVTLDFSALKSAFGSDSSYLKYHKLLYAESSEQGDDWLLKATRYGHGIGMSQRGAQQMAYEGWTYDQILDFYYNGTVLTTMELTEQPLPTSVVMSDITGKVNADGVSLRKGPGTSYDRLATLNTGEDVYVITDDDWCNVYVPSKQMAGYVSKQYLNITYPEPENPGGEIVYHQGVYKVTATQLNFRSSPVIANNVYYTLKKDEEVRKLGESADFFKVVDSRGQIGWCSSRYLVQTGPAVTEPPATPTPTPTPTPAPPMEIPYTAMVNTGTGAALNVRDSIAADGQIIEVIPDGSIVQVTERVDDTYVKITFNDVTGYVKEEYLIPAVATGVPTPTPELTPTPTPDPSVTPEPSVTPTPTPEVTPTPTPDVTVTPTPAPTATPTVTPAPTPAPTAEPTATPAPTDEVQQLEGVISADGANLRMRNAASIRGEIVGYIPDRSKVLILEDRDDGWLYVNYNSLSGYVVDDYVDFDGTKEAETGDALASQPTPTPTATPAPAATTAPPTDTTVTTGTITLASSSRLRVRSAASTSSSIIGYVANGAEVKVLEQLSSGWIKMEYGSLTGYVSSDYVKLKQATSVKGTIVDCDWLNVRSSNNTQSTVLGMIKNGDQVTLLESKDGWYRIEFKSGSGWISGKYVSVSDGGYTELNQTGTVTASLLRVRSGPGLSYDSLGMLSRGTQVEILGSENGFYKIKYQSGTGYVSSAYID